MFPQSIGRSMHSRSQTNQARQFKQWRSSPSPSRRNHTTSRSQPQANHSPSRHPAPYRRRPSCHRAQYLSQIRDFKYATTIWYPPHHEARPFRVATVHAINDLPRYNTLLLSIGLGSHGSKRLDGIYPPHVLFVSVPKREGTLDGRSSGNGCVGLH